MPRPQCPAPSTQHPASKVASERRIVQNVFQFFSFIYLVFFFSVIFDFACGTSTFSASVLKCEYESYWIVEYISDVYIYIHIYASIYICEKYGIWVAAAQGLARWMDGFLPQVWAFAIAFALLLALAPFCSLLFWAVSSRRAQQHKSTYFIGIYVLLWRRPVLTPQPLAPKHVPRPVAAFSLFRCSQPDTFAQSNEVVLCLLSLIRGSYNSSTEFASP